MQLYEMLRLSFGVIVRVYWVADKSINQLYLLPTKLMMHIVYFRIVIQCLKRMSFPKHKRLYFSNHSPEGDTKTLLVLLTLFCSLSYVQHVQFVLCSISTTCSWNTHLNALRNKKFSYRGRGQTARRTCANASAWLTAESTTLPPPPPPPSSSCGDCHRRSRFHELALSCCLLCTRRYADVRPRLNEGRSPSTVRS